MNLTELLKLLAGKKTYFTVGLLFLVIFGKWNNWWTVPEEVYVILLGAAMAFLRSGVGSAGQSQNDGPVPISPRAAPLLLLAAVITLAPGCARYTVAPGADPAVVAAEYAQETTLEVFDAFLDWERTNETALRKLNPEIHKFADSLRDHAPAWLDALAHATARYKAERTRDNLDTLRAAQAVLDAALAQARAYLASYDSR